MFLTSPSDPMHAAYAFYLQLGAALSTGVSSLAVIVIIVCVVIGFMKPWLFARIVFLMFVVIVIALWFAHAVGKF